MKKPFSACGLLLGLVFFAGNAHAQLDESERAIIDWVDANTVAPIELLENIVNIGSGTMNTAGVR